MQAIDFKVQKTQALKMDKNARLRRWGANLREIRLDCGYRNQGDLAKAMTEAGYDITQPGISRAENGNLDKPQEDIADFFIKHHRKPTGEAYTREEIFSIPVDWQEKYYTLLKEIENKPSENRVDELEKMVRELTDEVRKLKDDKGKDN